MSQARGTLIFLLLAQWATVMSQGMPPQDFPPLPQDFKEMAKKMMIICSKKGYSPPILMDSMLNSSFSKPDEMTMGKPIFLFASLLSSLPPLSSSNLKPNETEPALNMTEKMCNSSNLPQMIEHIWNTTEKKHCFMRAFLAPLSWEAIVHNATQFDPEQLRKLLWAAKPFLEMSPSSLMLPSTLQGSQLPEMMQTFNEVFVSLSEEQRNDIRRWMKERVIETDPSCAPNHSLSGVPSPPMPVQPAMLNSSVSGCQPKMPWLKAEVLRMMGRFISRLPEAEVRGIPPEEMCKFFQSPEFPFSFNNVSGMQAAIAQTLMQRLKQECFNAKQNFSNQMDRLGYLVCFYDDPQSLNATQIKKLLHQLGGCEPSGIDEMRKQLVRKLMADGEPPTSEMLHSLGSGMLVLSPSILSSFSRDTLNSTMSSLSQTEWKPAQAKILAQKLLEKVKDINGEKLLSLGSMVRGVDSELLKNVKAQGLLGSEGLKNISERLSSLQKKALLVGMRADVNASHLVKEVPDALIASLSLSILDKANLNSLDQLEGRSWSSTQSVYLLKKIVSNGLKPEQIRKLGQAVQGVTCSMIDGIAQSDTLEATQTLAKSFNLLSRTQVHCMASKLFQSLEKQRPGYFTNMSKSELQAIPALLLIHLPVQVIQGLPASMCPYFLEKISQANLSSLPNSAPSRRELRNKALSCLGKNASAVSAADISSLGPLVCELDPTWISSLKPDAQNFTVQALASCKHIPRPSRAPLFTLLTNLYGAPSNWSEDVVKSLGPLLLLNDAALDALSFKTWLKKSLSDLQHSLEAQVAGLAPEEFSAWPNLSALQRKLFQLKTKITQQRRRRETLVPTLAMIEDLREGNVLWSPAQLSSMTAQTFRDAMSTLGEIRNYTTEQLAALRDKATEAWGDVSMLNESKIVETGCVSQSFNAKQLQNLSITSLDTLELLSVCQWNQTQKEAVLQGFVNRTGMKMAKLGALEMAGLGQFICGLQPNETEQLNTTEFKDAVGDIGRASCPLSVLECLKKKAVAAFGGPKGWSEADVSVMGNIIAGLNATELGQLNSSVLPFIHQSAISLILPERLAALSVSQLRALGPDNAAALTTSQRAALGVEQRAAVDQAVGLVAQNPETTTTLPQKGGAPKQSMLGLAVLLQPLALLLLGYIC
ncbi:otoancorin isoform X2 [Pangasianodon hypophthalmus]|uniref:otoancorin isoform X2 n=1 Tax=Pangasianodon hypophthalmus TaxID=310915 RepID=UPI00230822FD|nr:otoancorin isoform X2 [Pangasianodon hypophthalmus]